MYSKEDKTLKNTDMIINKNNLTIIDHSVATSVGISIATSLSTLKNIFRITLAEIVY